jgi:hypothetical protein
LISLRDSRQFFSAEALKFDKVGIDCGYQNPINRMINPQNPISRDSPRVTSVATEIINPAITNPATQKPSTNISASGAQPLGLSQLEKVGRLFFKSAKSFQRTTIFDQLREFIGRVRADSNASEPIAALKAIIIEGRGSSVNESVNSESWGLLLGLTLSALRAKDTRRAIEFLEVSHYNWKNCPSSVQEGWIEAITESLDEGHKNARGGNDLHVLAFLSLRDIVRSGIRIKDSSTMVASLDKLHQSMQRDRHLGEPLKVRFDEAVEALSDMSGLPKNQRMFLLTLIQPEFSRRAA